MAEYLIDLNATQAAIRAGFSKKTAGAIGAEYLKKPHIAAAVSTARAKQMEKIEVTAQRVMDRLAAIAFQDVRLLHDEQGNLVPIHKLSDAAAAFVGGLEIIKKNAAAGDGVIDTVHKVKVVDPVKALEMLAKHFGLLVDKVEHSGDLTITWLDQE